MELVRKSKAFFLECQYVCLMHMPYLPKYWDRKRVDLDQMLKNVESDQVYTATHPWVFRPRDKYGKDFRSHNI